MVLLGVVAGCVQAPVANPGPLLLTGADSTSQAYTPDTVPVVVPALGGAPDVSTPSGDGATADAAVAAGEVPQMQAPLPTKAGVTAGPTSAATQAPAAQAQPTQGATTAAPAVVAPTTAQATVAKTTTAAVTQALVGPGTLELKCTHTSDGRSKAVLKWDNSGFTGSITVNGKTTYITSTKLTSMTAYGTELTSNHGICTARIGDSTIANSY